MIKMYERISIGTVPRRRSASVARFLDLEIPITKYILLAGSDLSDAMYSINETISVLRNTLSYLQSASDDLAKQAMSISTVSVKKQL